MQVNKYVEKIDIQNHYLNYKGELLVTNLCHIFNDLALKHSEDYNIGLNTLVLDGTTWMLYRIHIIIDSFPSKNDVLDFETWPCGIKSLFVQRYFQVLKYAKPIVKAYTEWMYVDLIKRRPLRQKPEVVELSTNKLGQLDIKSILKEKEVGEMDHFKEFNATYDNIDINKHVTQASYMKWSVYALPFDFFMHHNLKEVESVYMHEIMPDSKFLSGYKIIDKGAFVEVLHKLTDTSGKIVHCISKTIWEKVS